MMINEQYQNDEAIRAELLKTLEYYFSSKNLSKDEYLVSQMDEQFYVCLDEIAKFNKVKTLTSDKQFIREIIQQSSQLELDPETSNKVRSVNGRLGGTYQPKSVKPLANMSQQRSVLILREVSPDATIEHLTSLFENKEPVCPVCEKCESAGNDSWYVTFSNEEQAQRALQYLKTEVRVFMERPIKARIKAHAMPRSNTTGFVSLTPTSTPPPPPAQSHTPVLNTQSNPSLIQAPLYAPTITFLPGTQLSSPPVVIQAANQTQYEMPIYPTTNWPIPINAPLQNGVFLIDVNHSFPTSIELENKSEQAALNSSNSSQSSLNQNSPKPNLMLKQQQQQPIYNGSPFMPSQNSTLTQFATNQQFITQPSIHNPFYVTPIGPIFDEQKSQQQQQPPPSSLMHAPIHQLHQQAQVPAQTLAFFYNPSSGSQFTGLGHMPNQTIFNPVMANHINAPPPPLPPVNSQIQSSSTSSSSSSPKPNNHQNQYQQHQHQQQHYRPRSDQKLTNVQARFNQGHKNKFNQNNVRAQYHHQTHDSSQAHSSIQNAALRHDLNDDLKRTKSPLVFNSDSSFPPLNSTPTKNITISLQNLPVKKSTETESNETPNDPAIISCYKSADYIPNSPTIIKSNTIIDSKSQESKKATSETLANILNHDHKSDKNLTHYNHKKYDSYQRNRQNNLNKPQRKNDSNRYMRSSNSNHNMHSDSTDHKRKTYKEERVSISNENYANYVINNDDDGLTSCWNKKLTFAEIVQKPGSTSPSPTKSSNDSESIAAELNSPQPIAAE